MGLGSFGKKCFLGERHTAGNEFPVHKSSIVPDFIVSGGRKFPAYGSALVGRLCGAFSWAWLSSRGVENSPNGPDEGVRGDQTAERT